MMERKIISFWKDSYFKKPRQNIMHDSALHSDSDLSALLSETQWMDAVHCHFSFYPLKYAEDDES